jgi:SprT-like family protein
MPSVVSTIALTVASTILPPDSFAPRSHRVLASRTTVPFSRTAYPATLRDAPKASNLSIVGVPGSHPLGCGLCRGRERLRQTDLHAVYQQVNRDSFGSNLPDVSVKWAELPDDYGVAVFYPDGTVEIEIDRESVTSEEQLLETMRHESCHVMTHAVVEETRQDWHGDAFQTCMLRFK